MEWIQQGDFFFNASVEWNRSNKATFFFNASFSNSQCGCTIRPGQGIGQTRRRGRLNCSDAQDPPYHPIGLVRRTTILHAQANTTTIHG
jgi:hypothetical protein